MTLTEAVAKLQTRFDVYQQCEVDSTNESIVTGILNVAAKKFSRDTLSFWSSQSAFTLTADQYEYDLTDTAVCADRIFYPVGIYINGAWLQAWDSNEFFQEFNDPNAGSNSKPGYFTLVATNKIRIAPKPNASAVAATNYAQGWRYMATMDWNSPSTELEGPDEWHDLIVDRAYLDNSVSYGLSQDALNMRNSIQIRYDSIAQKLNTENRNRYRKLIRTGDRMGADRRVFGVGQIL